VGRADECGEAKTCLIWVTEKALGPAMSRRARRNPQCLKGEPNNLCNRSDKAGHAAAVPPGCCVMFLIGTKVRFIEPFRPEAVAPGAIGAVVEIEPLAAISEPPQRVRARFGDYVSQWLMRSQLEAVD
jgi:hypothetical protein